MLGYLILDSTIDYEETYKLKGVKKLADKLHKNNKNIVKSMLIAARDEATFKICNSFNNADRFYIKFSGMRHGDFTSQGAIAKSLIAQGHKGASSLEKAYKNYITLVKISHDFINSLLQNIEFEIDSENFKKFNTSYEIRIKG